MNKASVLLVAITLVVFLSANAQSATILDLAAKTPILSTLAKVVSSPAYAKIAAALANPNANLTLFAPTDNAFAQLDLPNDPSIVADILLYHVLPARVLSTDLKARQFPATLLNDKRFVNLRGQSQVVRVLKSSVFGITVNEATVIVTDIEADNGVIHIIDTVLSIPAKPSVVALRKGLSQLVGALNTENLTNAVDTLPQITIFAPINSAFAKGLPSKYDLKDVLLFHVVPNAVGYSTGLYDGQFLKTLEGKDLVVRIEDGNIFISGGSVFARVLIADIPIANGVVHVIDQVLLPL